uniref:Uncharacterized protein n=1 Tax=Timema douglasi TaxID=61478 RepID=A0A7R8ZAW5_TIMDO|nr:unnamed protein product [Timema douglasi]
MKPIITADRDSNPDRLVTDKPDWMRLTPWPACPGSPVLFVVALAALVAAVSANPMPFPGPYPAAPAPAPKETLKGAEAVYYSSYGALPYAAAAYPAVAYSGAAYPAYSGGAYPAYGYSYYG